MPHSAFRQIDHRPWPLPAKPWLMRQSWHDLAFLHWPVPASALRPLIPARLDVEQFDGSAWIGVVPFHMSGVMLRPLPDVPRLSAFAELNVRTYVSDGERPGVWFFSLDAANPLAVWMARTFMGLPYYTARMSWRLSGDEVRYESARTDARSEHTPAFRARYRPTSPVYEARPGTLEAWLTERYCLYAAPRSGTLFRTQIHHARWPLQQAEADIEESAMLDPLGLAAPSERPIVHFTKRIDAVAWAPERVR